MNSGGSVSSSAKELLTKVEDSVTAFLTWRKNSVRAVPATLSRSHFLCEPQTTWVLIRSLLSLI